MEQGLGMETELQKGMESRTPQRVGVLMYRLDMRQCELPTPSSALGVHGYLVLLTGRQLQPDCGSGGAFTRPTVIN